MFFEEFKDFKLGDIFIILLDIGLVSFLLYHIFLLLSHTRAIQLLLGVLILLLADVLARYLHLNTLLWVINNASTYLVIGLIVLMQPEIRRVIAGLAGNKLFQWLQPSRAVPINIILDAAASMASKRTGSIIVIIRSIKPQNIIDRSVIMNAEISAELIETIFWKNSPLHDGALIVEGSKIIAASCYLPLSTSRKLKRTYGARHRSALGISEETDALTIVTSEESGRISVVVNGEIFSPKASELESFIRSFTLEKGTKNPYRKVQSEKNDQISEIREKSLKKEKTVEST